MCVLSRVCRSLYICLRMRVATRMVLLATRSWRPRQTMATAVWREMGARGGPAGGDSRRPSATRCGHWYIQWHHTVHMLKTPRSPLVDNCCPNVSPRLEQTVQLVVVTGSEQQFICHSQLVTLTCSSVVGAGLRSVAADITRAASKTLVVRPAVCRDFSSTVGCRTTFQCRRTLTSGHPFTTARGGDLSLDPRDHTK